MSKYIWVFIAGVIVGALSLILLSKGCGVFTPDPVVIHDETVVERYHDRVDTVDRWYEITKKVVVPKEVFVQKVDSIFIEKTKDMDVMLGVEKKRKKLRIFALNQNDSLLKEMWYEGVGSEFTAYSAVDRVVVKSKLWYWNGLNASFEHTRPVSEILGNSGNPKYENDVSLTTGINYKDTYYFNIGTKYSFEQKDIKLKAGIQVRLF